MKRNVRISTYSLILSLLIIIMMTGVLVYDYRKDTPIWLMCILGAFILLMIVSALFYAPISIEVNSKMLVVHRILRNRRIPLTEIASIAPCSPTMGAKRICGSGGWFGYWGLFSEKDLGKYFAYYGKASDCFLVTLKNGTKYMLGCDDPQSMISCVKQYLTEYKN